jgi:hypothetical protein
VFTDNGNGTATLQADLGGTRRLYNCTLTATNGGPLVTQPLSVMYGRFVSNQMTMVVPAGSQPYGTERMVTTTIPNGLGGPPATGTMTVSGGAATCMAALAGNPASATCGVTPAVGVTQIQAAYSPGTDPHYASDMGIPQGITVTPVAPSLTISPSPAMPTVGMPAAVTLSAAPASVTSAAPTGTFELRENGVIVPGCGALALNTMGQATCNMTFGVTGMRTLLLTYSGDTNYTTNTTMLSVTVNP